MASTSSQGQPGGPGNDRAGTTGCVFLALAAVLASSIFLPAGLSAPTRAGEPVFEFIGEIPIEGLDSLDVTWDLTGQTYYIAGGMDRGGIGRINSRFIMRGNETALETLEMTNTTTGPSYQRYTAIECNPRQDLTLLLGIEGPLWKLNGTQKEAIELNRKGPFWSIAWDPEGRYALIGGWNFILKYEDGMLEELETGGHGLSSISWEPGGSYALVADGSSDELMWFDGTTFRELSTLSTGLDGYAVWNVAFSPSTEFALVGSSNYSVNGPYDALLGFDGTGFTVISHPITAYSPGPLWNPNGSFALLGGDGRWRYSGGNVESNDIGLDGGPLAWSPDGKYLLFLRDNATTGYHEIWKWETNSGVSHPPPQPMAPTFTSTPPVMEITKIVQDRNCTIDIECDREGEALTEYSIVTAPGWLTLNGTTGILTGTPGNGDVGCHWIYLEVRDRFGLKTGLGFALEVLDENDPPSIITRDIERARQGELYYVVYQASDPDPPPTSFCWSLATGADFLTLNASTGLLWGMPDGSDVGSWPVNVSVGDGRGGQDCRNFTLVVEPAEPSLKIVTPPMTSIPEGSLYSVQYAASDPVSPRKLTWGLNTTALWLAMDSHSGLLSGTPAHSDIGIFSVNVSVSDGNGAIDNQRFLLTVQATRHPPSWSGAPGNITLREGDDFVFVARAVDPDAGDLVAYGLNANRTGGPALDPATGLLRWFNATAGTWALDLTAADGNFTITHRFTIIVLGREPPIQAANNRPVIGAIPDHDVRAGQTLAFVITGRDDDQYDTKNLTFTLISPIPGMRLSTNGSFAWTPSQGQAGRHTVTVALSDGKDTATSSFVLTVIKTGTGAGDPNNTAAPAGLLVAALAGGVLAGAAIAYLALRRAQGATRK